MYVAEIVLEDRSVNASEEKFLEAEIEDRDIIKNG